MLSAMFIEIYPSKKVLYRKARAKSMIASGILG
jgi:hypothetical protein